MINTSYWNSLMGIKTTSALPNVTAVKKGAYTLLPVSTSAKTLAKDLIRRGISELGNPTKVPVYGDMKTLDFEKLYHQNSIAKKDIRDDLFGGRPTIFKTIKKVAPQKNKNKSNATFYKTLQSGSRGASIIGTIIAKNLLRIKGDIDVENNKVVDGKQTMKLSKVLRKALVKNGFDKEDIDDHLQELSKYWGTKKDKLNIVWSTDPLYLVRQSDGSGWDSCHKEASSGILGVHSNSHLPWVSHALDYTSTVVLLESAIPFLYQSRVMVYINTKEKYWSLGRFYPGLWKSKVELKALDWIREKMKEAGYSEKWINFTGKHRTRDLSNGAPDAKKSDWGMVYNKGGLAWMYGDYDVWRVGRDTSADINKRIAAKDSDLRKVRHAR